MREFNLLENYPKLDQPRYVASNLRTIKERLLQEIERKIFLTAIETLVMGVLNMMGDGRK